MNTLLILIADILETLLHSDMWDEEELITFAGH